MAGLAVEEVGKSFGAVRAVDRVSFAVAEGTFVSILGPSGCGKTTLLRLIAGLESPSSGRIRIGADDVTRLPPEKRGLGLMFQSYALFPHMTVAENLRFPLRMRAGLARAEEDVRIKDALALVRLEDLGERLPRALSGGQQQRVALARAIIDRPKLLLLDEPLSNLDALLREEMQVELIELRRKVGITTVMVTHDQGEALSLSDRIVLMKDGRIEQEAAPREIYARPATAFAADFLGAANLIEAQLQQSPKGWSAILPGGSSVPVPRPADGRAGRRTLAIRQEDLAFAPEGGEGLPVTLVAEVYRGASIRHVVALGDLRLKLLGARPAPVPVGAKARVVWPAERVILL